MGRAAGSTEKNGGGDGIFLTVESINFIVHARTCSAIFGSTVSWAKIGKTKPVAVPIIDRASSSRTFIPSSQVEADAIGCPALFGVKQIGSTQASEGVDRSLLGETGIAFLS